MPLVTNRCTKHKNAYPEEQCPLCMEEEEKKHLDGQREFFRMFGGVIVMIADDGEKQHKLTVEDVYQHFKARLLSELQL